MDLELSRSYSIIRMLFFKKIFGLLTPLEKKRYRLFKLRRRAEKADRAGNVRLSGKIYHDIEMLETEIVETMYK